MRASTSLGRNSSAFLSCSRIYLLDHLQMWLQSVDRVNAFEDYHSEGVATRNRSLVVWKRGFSSSCVLSSAFALPPFLQPSNCFSLTSFALHHHRSTTLEKIPHSPCVNFRSPSLLLAGVGYGGVIAYEANVLEDQSLRH